MKKIFYLFMLISFNGLTQNQELLLGIRYGLPSVNFKIQQPDITTRYDYRELQSFSDKGIVLSYKYRIWKWGNLFLTTGVDYSQSKHYQSLISKSYAMLLENIVLKKNRFGLHFGISKQFHFDFMPNLRFDIGSQIYFKLIKTNSQNYSSKFKSNNEDWIQYKYELITYDKFYVDSEGAQNYTANMFQFNLGLRRKLTNKIDLLSEVNLITKYEFYYDYSYTVNYFINNSTNPTSTDNFYGNVDDKNLLTTNFVYCNIGVTYNFGKE